MKESISGKDLIIWNNLDKVTRQDSINIAKTRPIISKHPYKNLILLNAKDNYIKTVQNYRDSSWSSFKVKLEPQSSDILNIKGGWPTIHQHEQFYDYSYTDPLSKTNEGQIWVSFANKYLGGGYKCGGWVQEEIITATFYEMALGIIEYEKKKLNLMNINECFIWLNLLQCSKAVPITYGRLPRAPLADQPIGNFNVDDYITLIDTPYMADFISIDAPKRVNSTDPYSLQELQHLFVKAFVGFRTCVLYDRSIIHTGNWGAGVFNNDVELIFIIQVLAAKLAGVTQIHFWGSKDRRQTKRINTLMNDILIPSKLESCTFTDVFNTIKTLFKITFSDRQVLEPILIQKWYWLNDHKQWIPYDDKMQSIISSQLTDRNKIIKFSRGNYNYTISYSLSEGWNQVNIDTKKQRSITKM